MQHKRLLLAVFSAAFFLSAGPLMAQTPPQPKLRLTLQDCLKMASENNAKLSARDYAIEGSRWRLEEAQARFWPILEYSHRMAPAPLDALNAAQSFFGGDLTFFTTSKVGVGIPLYAFGQLTTAQNLAKQGIEAAKVERNKDETKIHSEIKQLYYGIQLSHELNNLAQDAVNKINNKLKKEEETHEHSPYDILKLKVFKSDLERRIDEANAKEKVARHALKIQLGLPDEQSFELASYSLEPAAKKLEPLENYVDKAMEERPDSHLINIGVESKRLEQQLEKRKLFPRVGLGGFFEFGRTTDNVQNVRATDSFNNPFNFTRAGVGLELKGQFDFHVSNAKIKRLGNEFYKAQIESQLAKRGIGLEVEESYREVKRLKTSVDRAEERQKMARQMMFLSKTNLDIGVGEEQQYTDALQLVLLTRGEYYKTLFDYNIALAKLEEKIGRREGYEE